MLLDIGAGYRPYDDGRSWVHQDLNPGPHIEIVGDARSICSHPEIGPNSAQEIRACHILEHFPFSETVAVLNEWRSALVPGGMLYIEVPNLAGHIHAWIRGESTIAQLVTYIYGEQDFPGNSHYAGFDEKLLAQRLTEASFIDVHTQDIGLVVCAFAHRAAEEATDANEGIDRHDLSNSEV